MKWINFDAKKPSPINEKFIDETIRIILEKRKLSGKTDIVNFVNNELIKYEQGNVVNLNKIIAIDIFKPEEIDITPYESCIDLFRNWLSKQEFNFNETSENLKKIIASDFSNYAIKVYGTRGYKLLDNLIEINGMKIAIEIELSINIGNGYFSLLEAIKQNKASFGIMIVPWTPKKSGQADESKGLDRADLLAEATDGKFPIIRLAIIRELDVMKIMKERYS